VPKTLAYKLYRACNKQNLCCNYSTRGFPCGTLQTPFDVTPCIMTYVSRNMYAYMYRTSLSSSPLEKTLFLYQADELQNYKCNAAVGKPDTVVRKPIIFLFAVFICLHFTSWSPWL